METFARIIKTKRMTNALCSHYSFNKSNAHFTVVCLVSWSLSESEAGVGFVLLQTCLQFGVHI